MEDLSELKFAKLYSPKMKSVYWRHFGFPSNENDDIITKQNVVCMVCHKVLTNHGNTTNLRAHLQHRHKDLFKQICKENAITIPPRKKFTINPPVTARNVSNRRVKLEYIHLNNNDSDSEQAAAAATVMADDDEQSMLYESMVPLTYDEGDPECQDGEVGEEAMDDTVTFAKIELNDNDDENVSLVQTRKRRHTATGTAANSITIKPNEALYKSVERKPTYLVQSLPSQQINTALLNIVTEDLRNVDTLFEPGMTAFVRLVSGESTMPTAEKIEDLLREQHINKFEIHSEFIKLIAQEKPYSLGFDLFTNIEQKRFLTIYFNYINDGPTFNLVNQVYVTVEYNEFTLMGEVLLDFDLQNCTAAIVNYDYDDVLKQFLKDQNIPCVLAFDFIVEKCLYQVFNMPEVKVITDQVRDLIQRYAVEINTKDLQMPIRYDEFLWTHYDWLKFFSESISWSEEFDSLVNSVKAIIEAISALVVTLETLKGEDIPYISMLAPVTTKILSKKLSINEHDDPLVAKLKQTTRNVLHSYVIADENLTIAALLDPRFHRLTHIEDFDSCLRTIKKKYSDLTGNVELDNNLPSTSKESGVGKQIAAGSCGSSNSSLNNGKKSKLELFFDLNDSIAASAKHIEDNLEADLKRYRSEVFVTLDESPYNWWNKMGHAYGTLCQLAPIYQCVPGVVNSNFKKPIKQQVSEFTKRSMLTGELVDAIIYLNHHK